MRLSAASPPIRSPGLLVPPLPPPIPLGHATQEPACPPAHPPFSEVPPRGRPPRGHLPAPLGPLPPGSPVPPNPPSPGAHPRPPPHAPQRPLRRVRAEPPEQPPRPFARARRLPAPVPGAAASPVRAVRNGPGLPRGGGTGGAGGAQRVPQGLATPLRGPRTGGQRRGSRGGRGAGRWGPRESAPARNTRPQKGSQAPAARPPRAPDAKEDSTARCGMFIENGGRAGGQTHQGPRVCSGQASTRPGPRLPAREQNTGARREQVPGKGSRAAGRAPGPGRAAPGLTSHSQGGWGGSGGGMEEGMTALPRGRGGH